MKRLVSLRWRWAALAGALPLAVGAVSLTSTTAPVLAGVQPNKIQSRLLDGVAQMALGLLTTSTPRASGLAVQDPPSDYTPNRDGECPVRYGDDVRVDQQCLNVSAIDLQGRGQAQNETAIAVNPENPDDLLAASNDYTYGDGLAGGTVFSTDGGRTWENSQVPLEFTRGSDFSGDPYPRMYWQSGGDPSVAWDTQGNAYFAGLHFNRGVPTSDIPDASSGVYVYRSTQNDGASWSMPGTAVTTQYLPAGSSTGLPLDDKPYMTVDDWHNAYTDRIFVTWTLFATDGTAYIYGAYSTDYGKTFSSPTLVSTNSPDLCPNTYGLATTNGDCNENQFSDPFFGPDGSLYVVYDNYNNGVSSSPSCPVPGSNPPATQPCDNHNQVLVSKSTDGGATFSAPVQVAQYNDLPDCATYQGGQDLGRACVPEKGAEMDSVFRAANYPSGSVSAGGTVAVTFGSYISADSNPDTGCVPQGFSPTTGNNLYTGVKTYGACANKILLSVSTDGGMSFSGTGVAPTADTVASQGSGQVHTDQWWQWSAFAPDGTLEVSYYDRQYGDDELNAHNDVTLSSSDNLMQFAERRVTSWSMPNPTQFPDSQGNSLFFGDYSGLTASSVQANPLWTDTRDMDLIACGSTPHVCSFVEPDGIPANDQTDFTASLPLSGGQPQR
jgi:hypothetical protein